MSVHMSRAIPKDTEIIGTIKRSSLPIIIVEGKDDIHVYREIVKRAQNDLISILACDSRSTLLKVFDQREQFVQKKVVFIADQDNYTYSGIPQDYTGIHFTNGYCLENDLFSGSRIDLVLMTQEETTEFDNLIDTVCDWYAFEIDNILTGKPHQTATHINQVYPIGKNGLCPNYCTEINYRPPSNPVLIDLKTNYERKLRGKQIFQCMTRILSKKDRYAKYNDKQLVDLSLTRDNAHLDRLKEIITAELN